MTTQNSALIDTQCPLICTIPGLQDLKLPEGLTPILVNMFAQLYELSAHEPMYALLFPVHDTALQQQLRQGILQAKQYNNPDGVAHYTTTALVSFRMAMVWVKPQFEDHKLQHLEIMGLGDAATVYQRTRCGLIISDVVMTPAGEALTATTYSRLQMARDACYLLVSYLLDHTQTYDFVSLTGCVHHCDGGRVRESIAQQQLFNTPLQKRILIHWRTTAAQFAKYLEQQEAYPHEDLPELKYFKLTPQEVFTLPPHFLAQAARALHVRDLRTAQARLFSLTLNKQHDCYLVFDNNLMTQTLDPAACIGILQVGISLAEPHVINLSLQAHPSVLCAPPADRILDYCALCNDVANEYLGPIALFDPTIKSAATATYLDLTTEHDVTTSVQRNLSYTVVHRLEPAFEPYAITYELAL